MTKTMSNLRRALRSMWAAFWLPTDPRWRESGVRK